MLIQCSIKRDGPTRLSLERFDYEFKPRPELTGGDEVTKVCPVNSKSHADYLLRLPDFEEYRKPVETPAAMLLVKDNGPVAAITDCLTLGSFFALKNVAQVKSVIKKCTDKELLDAIGKQEHEATTRREWVITALDERLKELEP